MEVLLSRLVKSWRGPRSRRTRDLLDVAGLIFWLAVVGGVLFVALTLFSYPCEAGQAADCGMW